MIVLSIMLIVLLRIISLTMKFAFNNLTLIDLKKISENEKEMDDIVKNRVTIQFMLSFLGEITIVAISFLFYFYLKGIQKTLLFVFIYVLLEKIFISVISFFSREKVVEILMPVFNPLFFLIKIFVYPAVKIAVILLKKEDVRVDDEENREEEEKAFIDVATEEGIIEENEKDLIKGVLDFGDTIVREVMTPRTDIIAVREDITFQSLIEKFKQAKHSRLPVFRDTIDNIVGIVHLKDVLSLTENGFDLSKIVQEPYFIPETKKVLELLRELQGLKLKMAIVIDEYGGTAGVVTIEDLVEEIVGEIEDEHDVEKSLIERINESTYIVDGSCNIHTFVEESGIELDLEDVDTMGGAIFAIFGRIPEEGEITTYGGNIKVTVLKMQNKRVKKIKIEKIEGEKND